MKLITRKQIEDILPGLDLMPAIEEGFLAYSAGRAVVPPPDGPRQAARDACRDRPVVQPGQAAVGPLHAGNGRGSR